MQVLVAALVLWVVLLPLLWLGTLYSFAASLKAAHPELWGAQASPTWLVAWSFLRWPIMGFLRSPAYQHVTDARVLRLGRRLHVLHRLYLMLLVAFAGVCAYLLLSRGALQ